MPDTLYEIVSRESLEDLLKHLNVFTALPVRFQDDSGQCLLAFGDNGQPHSEDDERIRLKAASVAAELGGSYIFSLGDGPSCMACALMDRDKVLGTVFLGPFLMDPVPEDDDVRRTQTLQTLQPARVTSLSRLTEYLLQSLLPAERAVLMYSREKLSAQSRIGEAIQMYKNQALSSSGAYFYEKERELLTKVRTGAMPEAKALLNDLLGYALFSEGWFLPAVRVRAIELTTLLSRVALDGGANADSTFRLNERYLSLISGQNDIEEISLLLLDVVEGFMNAMFSRTDRGNRHIRRALSHIARHYAEPLRVQDVAEVVGLNPDYFGSLFRKTVGESFHDHLTRVRIEEGKLLLLSTDHLMADIAAATGFADQSSFCKAFKKYTGVPPGRYRSGA